MPKRISKPKHPRDVNLTAHQLVAMSTGQIPTLPEPPVTTPAPLDVSRVMAEMGRKGGQIGGKRRLQTMTSAQRRKIAKKAAAARWAERDR
jgi:hypothetical protein